MNPEPPKPSRDEIEARLTALLLGELSHEEATLLNWMIGQDAELAKLHERLKLTVDLTREAVTAEKAEAAASQSEPLKLSNARREKLLAQFKTVKPTEFARPKRRQVSTFVAVAAVLTLLGLLAAILLPSLAAAKRKSLHFSAMTEPQTKNLEQSMHEEAIAAGGPLPKDKVRNEKPATQPQGATVYSQNVVGYVNQPAKADFQTLGSDLLTAIKSPEDRRRELANTIVLPQAETVADQLGTMASARESQPQTFYRLVQPDSNGNEVPAKYDSDVLVASLPNGADPSELLAILKETFSADNRSATTPTAESAIKRRATSAQLQIASTAGGGLGGSAGGRREFENQAVAVNASSLVDASNRGQFQFGASYSPRAFDGGGSGNRQQGGQQAIAPAQVASSGTVSTAPVDESEFTARYALTARPYDAPPARGLSQNGIQQDGFNLNFAESANENPWASGYKAEMKFGPAADADVSRAQLTREAGDAWSSSTPLRGYYDDNINTSVDSPNGTHVAGVVAGNGTTLDSTLSGPANQAGGIGGGGGGGGFGGGGFGGAGGGGGGGELAGGDGAGANAFANLYAGGGRGGRAAGRGGRSGGGGGARGTPGSGGAGAPITAQSPATISSPQDENLRRNEILQAQDQRAITTRYASPSDVASALNSTYGTASFSVDPNTHQIIVSSDASTYQQVQEVIKELDSPARQMLVMPDGSKVPVTSGLQISDPQNFINGTSFTSPTDSLRRNGQAIDVASSEAQRTPILGEMPRVGESFFLNHGVGQAEVSADSKPAGQVFVGYDDPGPFVPTGISAGQTITSVLPSPRFRLQTESERANGTPKSQDQIAGKDKVPVLGDVPYQGRLFRYETQPSVNGVVASTPTPAPPSGSIFVGETRPYSAGGNAQATAGTYALSSSSFEEALSDVRLTGGLRNSLPTPAQPQARPASGGSAPNMVWGSFDGSTIAPTVSPNGTRISDLESQVVNAGGTLGLNGRDTFSDGPVVSSGKPVVQTGANYYSGLTRDEAGGLRNLYRSDNMVFEAGNGGTPAAANPEGTAIIQAATDGSLTSGSRDSINAPAVGTITGVLTDPQFRVAVRALEQRKGELAQNDNRALGFDWFMGNAVVSQDQANNEVMHQGQGNLGLADGSVQQDSTIGYNATYLAANNNSPNNPGDEYRRNSPVLYYAYDTSFSNYFSPQAASEAVNNAYFALSKTEDQLGVKESPKGASGEKVSAATLVQDGKLLLEMGRIAEADAKLKQAIQADPQNASAFYYQKLAIEAQYAQASKRRDVSVSRNLVKVENEWENPVSRDSLPVPNQVVTNFTVTTGNGQQATANEAKPTLDELQNYSQILATKMQAATLDRSIPQTAAVTIVDLAKPETVRNPSLLNRLTGKLTQDYESVARVQITSPAPDVSTLESQAQPLAYDSNFIQAEADAIKSEAVLNKAIEKLNLNDSWKNKNDEEQKNEIAKTRELLKKSLDIQPVKNTSLLDISVKSDKPEEAAKMANAVAKAYGEYRAELRAQLSGGGIAAMEALYLDQQKKIAAAKTELAQLEKSKTSPVSTLSGLPVAINKDEIVTKIVPIKYLDVSKLAVSLSEFVSPKTTIAANDAANSIIITDTQENVRRMTEAIKNLDRPALKVSTNAPIPQPEILARENNFSTFSLNVSDVSFKLAAASLAKGQLPDAASIRTEEFINAFDYRDPEPKWDSNLSSQAGKMVAPSSGVPVVFASERARYPFAHNRELLRFSVKTGAQGRQAGRPLNLVLLLDNSGSMERSDRVAIIQQALRILASKLQPQDSISIITFSRTPRLWVDGVAGDKAGASLDQVGGITPEGGTNLEEAMKLAYQTASRHYRANGVNRVVLLTDGAANLGNVDPEMLKQNVEAQRKQGIALDCFGIGWDGFNDDLLEVLSRNGDGRYGFINSPEEAATGFAGQLAGALKVAAQDVKVQVEFNPKRVTSWRQIGYAKHQLTKQQFRDNTVDAAEIAAQEAGNALYTVETNPQGEGPVATVRVRYKVPGTTDYRELSWDVAYTGNAPALEQSSPAMRLAATASAFGEWLAQSPFAQEVTPDQLLTFLRGVPEICGADARPKQLETMIREAKSLAGK